MNTLASVQDAAVLFPSESGSAEPPKPQPQDKRKSPAKTAKPHYAGHRARLRERFLKAGGEALADYEMMELVLFRVIPRRDVKPLAKSLIDRFGGFAEAVGAPTAQLSAVPGMSDAAAGELKIVLEAGRRLTQTRVMHRPVMASWSAVEAHCRAAMADEVKEQFRVLFLDRKNRLIADEILGRGSVAHAPVYPREVAERALHLNASAVVLAHNHPSGDPTPSQADITMTGEVAAALAALGVTVHDHLVIGKAATASFQRLGLL